MFQYPLLPAEKACNQCGRDKKQQIDAPSGILGQFQHNGEPQHQQTAAAHTDAGKKAQNGTEDQKNWQGF